ncbi:MAG: hypothetical protein JXB00_18470 [Bacteroidales bacterium]|nr:hypothetical protein [Bacteroidales bacterium]
MIHNIRRFPLLLAITGLSINFQSNASSLLFSQRSAAHIPPADSLTIVIKGVIVNNFRETVDSVKISCFYSNGFHTVYSDKNGSFTLQLPASPAETDSVKLTLHRYDYHLYDTIVALKGPFPLILAEIVIFPKYKILLKGRVFAGSIPVEDVDVTIRHRNSIMTLKTLGCYYDHEDFWNCLYNGMFKTDIVTEDPNDSIEISFSKEGFRSQVHQLKFSEYTGDIMKYKLRYADTVPGLPGNNLALKISNPLDKDWFVGLSYYAWLKSPLFNRFRPGLEFSLMTINRTSTITTLPGAPDAEFDTVYTRYFAGPSFLFFVTKPYVRKFSTYLGTTFSLELTRGDFVLQPFIGTRFFIDMRKSLSIDLRYMGYSVDVVEYTFIYNGNALHSNKEIDFKKLLLNIGLQINF